MVDANSQGSLLPGLVCMANYVYEVLSLSILVSVHRVHEWREKVVRGATSGPST